MPDGSNTTRKPVLRVRLSGGHILTVYGREAETLRLLMKAGANGLTTSEASIYGAGRRTSAYVHQLRKKGVAIVTVMEDAGDGSRIGRYFLDEVVAVAPLDLLPPSSTPDLSN